MFVIIIRYKKPLSEIESCLAEHRAFLDTGYQKDYLLASGPQNPRTGGIILARLKDKQHLEKFLEQDPFFQRDLADYEIIEFNPVKHNPNFLKL